MKIPTICRYCGGRVKLTTASEIYDKSNETIYLCTNCNSYVGCYRGTDHPMGRLANAALRMKRRETHEVFDRFWRSAGMTRSQGYQWMAASMGVSKGEAHIGQMEMDGCERLIQLCRDKSREVA